MHPNPIYRQTSRARNIAFARARAFGMLALNGDEAPLVSHVPFELSSDGTVARLHLVRSNPIARMLTAPRPAMIAVQGPDGYISPDWYGLPDQVPTWNYVAVHLRGTLHPMPGDAMRGVLDDLSAQFETRLPDKHPWTSDKMSDGVMERMMRQILPFELQVTEIDGTWKLGQNKPEAARLGAADGVAKGGQGLGLDDLATLMRAPPPAD